MGTGIKRIKNVLMKAGNSEPSFSYEGFFIITFKREVYIPETAQETAQENLFHTTSEKILILLKDNPKYTKNDLMRILKKGDGTVKEHLAKLKQIGKLKRIGPNKGGYWEVVVNK